MKTQKELIAAAGHINPKLVRAVVSQMGGWANFAQSAEDVASHGIDGGFSGFICYSETHYFAIKNRTTIVELLEETAAQLGEDVVQMVSNFGVFRTHDMDVDDKRDLFAI